MDLSPEDSFRLNVLLANKPQAIRIDESAMVVYGLSDKGEAKVVLNPVGREDQYLKRVRELLSGHVTGSPGGYPVFLKRWTRMGQMRDESLAQLMLLGEPEAVVAAVCSPGITDDLARRAWWAMQDAENARRMLGSRLVVQGSMGPVLAEFLVEFLPFETETDKMMESVRLVLQPGLIDQATRLELWKKSGRRPAYRVGFLAAEPEHLPEPSAPHASLQRTSGRLGGLAQAGNQVAALYLKLLSAPGQTYLRVVRGILGKPPTQDVVTTTLDLLRSYLQTVRPSGDPDQTLEQLEADAEAWLGPDGAQWARACLAADPECGQGLKAMRLLSGVGYGVLRPVLRDTTAIGSLMRRKLEPVIKPLDRHLGLLAQ
jgi:hypothetical protein